MEFVFCTNNEHKIQEVTQIMGSNFVFLKLKDVHFYDEIPEPFDTLSANAAIKANTVFFYCGKNCFAEDTGLFIDALLGEPGVYSARYAGEPVDSSKNIQKVMDKMLGCENRKAFFKTVISLVTQEGEWQFEGICHGSIAKQLSGKDGFGYDPIFIPDGYTQTFAEMDVTLKNNISHRKKAFDHFEYFLKHEYPNFIK
ncbi:MAG: RdgB/HAM1 family non-canonical purine NTP pyrophosphatase [Bacteroidetes bacterium]|nr:RdgB/HAM1 family non-canonical purine NTP pyrophosphatase [Bacteroidota bacterium]MBK8329979.1 RdgB/HAM1 family non-canonical purine NTP pyrophosphatase [Bacteroidota bacterium]